MRNTMRNPIQHNDSKQSVRTLIEKAEQAEDATEAMKFAQAAFNAAQAIVSIYHL